MQCHDRDVYLVRSENLFSTLFATLIPTSHMCVSVRVSVGESLAFLFIRNYYYYFILIINVSLMCILLKEHLSTLTNLNCY